MYHVMFIEALYLQRSEPFFHSGEPRCIDQETPRFGDLPSWKTQ